MNFYKRHLGDYAKDTRQLSMMEHGAYTLLLDYCYATEQPLPDNFSVACRICSAATKSERDAVRSVLDAYFPVGSDGLRHNKRAEQEIEENADKDGDRERKKENERERQRRLRERRSMMFDALRTAGETPEWNVLMSDLQRMYDALLKRDSNAHVTRDHTATRLQTPDSREETPSPPTPSADAKGAETNGHDLLGDAAPKRQRKRKPVTDVPTDFELTDAMYDWANGKGLSDDEVALETELCLNHHQGKGNARADWAATWRTWVLNAVKFKRERQQRRAS